MSGCFGSHPIDLWMEGELNRYLDSTEDEPETDEDEDLTEDSDDDTELNEIK